MEINERRRAFHTLDGLRGVAALIIVTRHVGLLATGISFPESFLAVDMFFLLSGFVIAYAYGERISRGGFLVEFLKIRLIRLYPLYLLGLLVGAVFRVGSIRLGTEGWHTGTLIQAIIVGVLMIPQTPLLSVGSSALDGPTWTLLPELVANLLYAGFSKLLTRTVLVSITALGAVGLMGCEAYYGTLDAGWDSSQLPVILSRLMFSFFGGVLLFKVVGDRRHTRTWVSWACLASVAVALTISPVAAYKPIYEIVLITCVFPLVLWAACQSEPGALSGRLFRFLGVISYAVYTLHAPVGGLVVSLLHHFARFEVERFQPASLLVFMAALILATWLIDEQFDAPVRRWLARRLLHQTHASAKSPEVPANG